MHFLELFEVKRKFGLQSGIRNVLLFQRKENYQNPIKVYEGFFCKGILVHPNNNDRKLLHSFVRTRIR